MTPGGYDQTGERMEMWKGDMIADWMSAKRDEFSAYEEEYKTYRRAVRADAEH